MPLWQIIAVAVVFLALLVIALGSRWYMGCGLGLLGAILGGVVAFGAGWYYVTNYHKAPRPRHDMDFGGMETPLLCLVALPALGVVLGLLAGIAAAHWLRVWSSDD
jgi:hypothetical protein